MLLAIDQIFSLAASIRPLMLPVVSSTNTTSTLAVPAASRGVTSVVVAAEWYIG